VGYAGEKVGFYLMTAKGYFVLKNFLEKYSSECIEYVVSCRDKNLAKDFYDEINALCLENKIKFYDYKTEKHAIETVESKTQIYRFAISWRWMIKNTTKLIVLHDSVLPRYRGFAPLVNALINGENEIGVTAILASEEYDKGDVVMQKRVNIRYPIKIAEAIEKISFLYSDIVNELYGMVTRGLALTAMKQDESLATYSPWLDDYDYFIDWTWDAQKIKRFVDAVGYPYDGAKSYVNGKIIRIEEVEVEEDVVVEDRERHIGKVLFVRSGCPVVICGRGLVKVTDMKDLNGNRITLPFRSRFTSKK